MREQSTDTVLMILPKSFGFNQQTAASNAFQNNTEFDNSNEIARREVKTMAEQLRQEGVQVWLEEDVENPVCPDAIFPNNWLGVHPFGNMVLYPMMAENRRSERREELIKRLKDKIQVKRFLDLSEQENQGEFLEGTGSLVFDHIEGVIYAVRSVRTSEELANKLANTFSYNLIMLDATDERGLPIYHTNVVLSIGTRFAILASSMFSESSVALIRQNMQQSGRMLIEITNDQVHAFAGNVLELKNHIAEKLIVISETAFNSLEAHQIAGLQQCGLIIPVSVKHIEHIGGGSVRCMLAEIFHLE
jgi:hypothetical protein